MNMYDEGKLGENLTKALINFATGSRLRVDSTKINLQPIKKRIFSQPVFFFVCFSMTRLRPQPERVFGYPGNARCLKLLNPLSPSVKVEILFSRLHTILTEEVGRGC